MKTGTQEGTLVWNFTALGERLLQGSRQRTQVVQRGEEFSTLRRKLEDNKAMLSKFGRKFIFQTRILGPDKQSIKYEDKIKIILRYSRSHIVDFP